MEQQELSKLSILPVNKTVVFYSPIEGKDVLVRTGTIPDGSCCYHSLLHACSKDYISLDEQGRKKLVERLRESLASKVDKERWEQLSEGLVAKIPFQENVNLFLTNFYKYVKSGKTKNIKSIVNQVIKNDEDNDTYKVILEMVTLLDFEKNILPSTYDECGDKPISVCKEKIVNNTTRFYKKIFKKIDIDESRKKYCIEKLNLLIQTITDESENNAFNEYVTSLKDTSVEVDRYTIGLISNRINRDIYFLDSRNRMPYREGGTDHIKKRKSVILLWAGGVHYEIVGRLLPGNKVQREFEPDDPLIVRIRTFLCNPEKISQKYPNLIPYLPKEHRQNIGVKSQSGSRSRSRSESRSESRSGSRSVDRSVGRSRNRKNEHTKKHKRKNKHNKGWKSSESSESSKSSESSESSESSKEKSKEESVKIKKYSSSSEEKRLPTVSSP